MDIIQYPTTLSCIVRGIIITVRAASDLYVAASSSWFSAYFLLYFSLYTSQAPSNAAAILIVSRHENSVPKCCLALSAGKSECNRILPDLVDKTEVRRMCIKKSHP